MAERTHGAQHSVIRAADLNTENICISSCLHGYNFSFTRELGAPSSVELALASAQFSSGRDFSLRTKAALRVELEPFLLRMYFCDIKNKRDQLCSLLQFFSCMLAY